jgi:hypothetical protein
MNDCGFESCPCYWNFLAFPCVVLWHLGLWLSHLGSPSAACGRVQKAYKITPPPIAEGSPIFRCPWLVIQHTCICMPTYSTLLVLNGYKIREPECEHLDWIHLPQHREYWRDLVNTKINLRVSWKSEDLLTTAERLLYLLLKDKAPWI